MNRLKRIALVLWAFTGLGINSCSTQNMKVQDGAYNIMLRGLLDHSVEELSVSEVQEMENVLFLDARAKAEYEVSHIQGAKWVGYDDFDLSRVSEVPKDQKIVVYCSVGYRSEKVAEQLEKAGYEVGNLYGGIFEWMNQEQAVYRENSVTNQVHAFDKTWGIWLKKGEKVYQ